jgi:RHS repeat-associated protein
VTVRLNGRDGPGGMKTSKCLSLRENADSTKRESAPPAEATTTSGGVQTGLVYSYDPMGRIKNYWQCTPYNCGSSAWQMTYNYDLAGDVTSYTYPEGFTVTNQIDQNQRITQVTSSWNDSTHPGTLATMTYKNWGALATLTNGCAGSGCTQTKETYDYNLRLQPVRIQLGTTSNASAYYCLVYRYYPWVGNPTSCSLPAQDTGNNGNVKGYYYQDNINTAYSHIASFDYDLLSRLIHAWANPVASGTVSYDLPFTYDKYGNVTCNPAGNPNGTCPDVTYFTSTNQIYQIGSAFVGYNAAGNLTSDGTYTYQYDPEGRLVSMDSGSTVSQTYNALGWRMQAIYPSNNLRIDYLHDIDGQSIGGYWGTPGQPERGGNQFIWGGGRELFDYEADGFHAMHANVLNSTTQSTTWTGGGVQERLFYPFGQTWESSGSVHFVFAGMPDGGPIDILQTITRSFSRSKRRWMTPDPLGGDVTNPQSLNRYAYVLNNPTTFTDPLGLYSGDCEDPAYADSHAECEAPPPVSWCQIFPLSPECTDHGHGWGGYGGGGGGGTASSAPPTGQPPLAGGVGFPGTAGNAFLGFHLFCSQSKIGPPVNTRNPAACILYFLGIRLGSGQLVGSLASATFVAGSITASFPAGTPLVGVGPTVSFAFNPTTRAACVGPGLAATIPAGKAVNFGPLIHGNLSEAPSVLHGASLSSNVQLSPFIGYQAIWNGAGELGGPTVGYLGVSISGTYSFCGSY